MRRLSWLLWLLIALMPVRGIAQSLMTGGAFGHGAAGAVAAGTAAGEAPCPMHAAAADNAALTADGSSIGDGTVAAATTVSPHACSLCSVCHSAVLPLSAPTLLAHAPHGAAPLPALGLGAGRAAPAELYRPPR